MKRTLLTFLVTIILLLSIVMPTFAQNSAPEGVTVNCDNGTTIENGVEVIINQMRSGFTYTATAVGINGFDPVLAVLDVSTGDGLCSDDEAAAGRYAANLPSSGSVTASSLSSQVTFNQNSSSTFADVALVVGGFGNQTGEFLLILEGMAATSADGAGDAFSVNITPGMVDSGVPLSMVMLTRGTASVDPLMYLADAGTSDVAVDGNGDAVLCDDAGDPSRCYGTGVRLDNYNVTIATGTLPGWQYDAMLTTTVEGLQLDSDRNNNYLTYYMTSYQGQTEGQYLLVFHMGITDSVSQAGDSNNVTTQNSGGNSSSGGLSDSQEQQGNQSQAQPTQAPFASNDNAPEGVTVNCDNGATIDNGVEVIINQMRSGFTYTATAVGINGFDPVLAVLDVSTGDGLCSDDEASAGRYAANLPSSGRVTASNLSSQVTFNQSSSSTFADVALVVGGFGNQAGEFLLILEGMAATSADGAGDSFSVNITPGMTNSGVPLSMYMLTRGTASVDPLMYLADAGTSDVAVDGNGDAVLCDDAGDPSRCYGTGVRLDNYNVTIATGTLPGWQYDAMLTTTVEGLQLDSDRNNNYLTYYMTSYQGQTEGQYLLVFHMGITD